MIVGRDADSRQHLWGQGPFWFSGGRRAHKERIEAVHSGGILPSFGPHGCVKPYCCLFVYIRFLLRSDGRCQTERESVLLSSRNAEPFLRCPWASFYTQGVTDRGQRRQEG